jgi:hypothetical protein
MIGVRRISGAGRGLLVVGAGLLLLSLFGALFFPSMGVFNWFTISGNRPELLAGSYTGIQVTELLNTLANGPYLWIAFAWLLVCAGTAIAIAGIGQKTPHFGTTGVVVLLLYAALLFLVAYKYNQQSPSTTAAISIGYGFVMSVAAAILIEAGARLPAPVPTRARVPAAGAGQEKA